jgi:hypothetical protein
MYQMKAKVCCSGMLPVGQEIYSMTEYHVHSMVTKCLVKNSITSEMDRISSFTVTIEKIGSLTYRPGLISVTNS